MIDLMLVEDDAGFSQRFADAVAHSETMRLIHTSTSVTEALQSLQTLRPDVLLVDLGLPDGNGIEVIRAAVARYPACDVLVVSVYGDKTNVLASIEAGASGYLLKDGLKHDILEHIEALRAGGSPMSPAIARQLLRRLQPARQAGAPEALKEHLTEREHEVLNLLSRGFNYQEIADILSVSKHTIGTYIKRMYRKLHVNSRSEAVFEAQKLGLLE